MCCSSPSEIRGAPVPLPAPPRAVPGSLRQNQTPPSQSPVQLSQELAEGNCDPHGVITDGGGPLKAMWDRPSLPLTPTPPAVSTFSQTPQICQGKVLWPQNGHSAGRKADREHFEEGAGGLDGGGMQGFLERRTRRKNASGSFLITGAK